MIHLSSGYQGDQVPVPCSKLGTILVHLEFLMIRNSMKGIIHTITLVTYSISRCHLELAFPIPIWKITMSPQLIRQANISKISSIISWMFSPNSKIAQSISLESAMQDTIFPTLLLKSSETPHLDFRIVSGGLLLEMDGLIHVCKRCIMPN